ncbi:aldo/keto reductase [Mycobacterium sp. 236(2023)]|uniref:aldo/keto reductase n=1 Tax=Mycobacterium sp. 236(2023) TaxID=3038163 RepID=UPI0024152F2A|nr:aldo/keto reductase [Mycobacterium sp. 236(2023)]MDG4667603.1 aldo/keto reductase [Mycobacterium sp. 236(2023)]
MTTLPTRRLGVDALEVSAIGLGFMSFRTSADADDEKQAKNVVDSAIDHGVTFFDTADIYGPEFSEILLGRVIQGRRDDLTIATKFGNTLDRATNPRALDGRPEYIRGAIEGSLRRLGIDHVDLYYQHRVDPHVPIEDTVGALKELVQAGKVRHIGLSEPGPQTLRRAHAVHPITAIQNEWSLFTRDIEHDALPVARELGIGIVTYSPLGRGWLSGRVQSESDISGTHRQHPRFSAEAFERNRSLAETVVAVASEVGVTPSQVALAWVLSRGEDVVPIPGTRHVEYLLENLGAAGVQLSQEQIERLEEIAGQVAGHRSIRPENLGTEAPESVGAATA